MAIVELKTYTFACDGCGNDLADGCEYSARKHAREAIADGAQRGGWVTAGRKAFCRGCAWRVRYERASEPEAVSTEVPARWVRGGDGTHWEGCYSVHWDCAIRALREQLDVTVQITFFPVGMARRVLAATADAPETGNE